MTITLPTSPLAASAKPKPVGNATETKPLIPGVVQRKVRGGSRWSLDVVMPTMSFEDAMAWTADLAASEGEEVVMRWPQPAGVIGAIGAPVVNGAGQSGTTLQVRGANASYVYKKGIFFTLVVGSNRWLHQIRAEAASNGAGQASLSIWPMLRVSPPDGAGLEFYEPKIQGWLGLNTGWDVDTAMNVGLAFSITEAR